MTPEQLVEYVVVKAVGEIEPAGVPLDYLTHYLTEKGFQLPMVEAAIDAVAASGRLRCNGYMYFVAA